MCIVLCCSLLIALHLVCVVLHCIMGIELSDIGCIALHCIMCIVLHRSMCCVLQ